MNHKMKALIVCVLGIAVICACSKVVRAYETIPAGDYEDHVVSVHVGDSSIVPVKSIDEIERDVKQIKNSKNADGKDAENLCKRLNIQTVDENGHLVFNCSSRLILACRELDKNGYTYRVCIKRVPMATDDGNKQANDLHTWPEIKVPWNLIYGISGIKKEADGTCWVPILNVWSMPTASDYSDDTG